MRTVVSGVLAAAAYWIVITTFLALAMPTQAEVEAYIEAAQVSAYTVPAIGQPLAG